jgi:hypothetical protein
MLEIMIIVVVTVWFMIIADKLNRIEKKLDERNK